MGRDLILKHLWLKLDTNPVNVEEESRICCLADMGNELNLFCTVLHMDDAHKMYFCNDLKFIF